MGQFWTPIDTRLNQILLPLMAIIRDETAAEDVRRFVVEANQGLMAARAETVEAEVVTVLWERLGEGDGAPGGEGPTMKDLAADLTDRMGPEKPFTARGVGGVVERLRLDKIKTRSGVCLLWSEQTKRILAKLARRYGIGTLDPASGELVNVVNVAMGDPRMVTAADSGVPDDGERR